MSWTVIVKNNSGSSQWIEDFGILLQDATQVTLTDTANYDEIGGSDQLKTQVAAGNLVINNGTSDLSIADGLNFITLENIDNTLGTFYTQSQLASGGNAVVDWGNITNAPAFGSPYWIEPVEVRALDVASVPVSAGAVTGDFIVDTDDDTIYQYDGAVWNSFLLGTEGTRVINLTDVNESVWELSGGTWTDTEQPTGSMAVLVGDDGDGKQAQYVYNDTSLTWVKIADVDWDTGDIITDITALSGAIDVNTGDIATNAGDIVTIEGDITNIQTDVTSLSAAIDVNAGDISTNAGDIVNLQTDVTSLSGAIDQNASDIADHLDGGASKHDASEIDVEGIYTNIPGTPTDLETALSGIDVEIGGIHSDTAFLSGAIDAIPASTPHNTLGEAYNQGGAGVGRVITSSDGAVKIDATSDGYAPLELTPTVTMPTSGLADGQLTMKGGILYTYDATRSKWLSVQRQFVAFGKDGNTRNQYIDFYAGDMSSNKSGLRLARNATIVSISAQLDVSDTATFHIRKNDNGSNITSLTVTGALGDQDITVDLATDFVQGEFLQCYADTTAAAIGATIKSPMVIVEIAWMA